MSLNHYQIQCTYTIEVVVTLYWQYIVCFALGLIVKLYLPESSSIAYALSSAAKVSR